MLIITKAAGATLETQNQLACFLESKLPTPYTG